MIRRHYPEPGSSHPPAGVVMEDQPFTAPLVPEDQPPTALVPTEDQPATVLVPRSPSSGRDWLRIGDRCDFSEVIQCDCGLLINVVVRCS
jgi:hypothetical protein